MSERKCVNCGHNIRKKKIDGTVKCECEIDGRYIGYLDCFEHWCNRWCKDHTFDGIETQK